MPKTGFPAPNKDSTAEYILEYIEYKRKKMEKLMNQSKKLLLHVIKARKILNTVIEKEENEENNKKT